MVTKIRKDELDKGELEEMEDDKINEKVEDVMEIEVEEKKEILNLGGLYVVGTERHESRRIDNQLRGRSGRQGDPGESRFYISLEDDLMRRYTELETKLGENALSDYYLHHCVFVDQCCMDNFFVHEKR